MMNITPHGDELDSTTRSEAFSWTVAAALHALLFIWNPIIIKSQINAIHDFVTVDMVDSAGPAIAEPPKKMTLMETLKDMLLTPKSEDIAHMAPQSKQPVAAPQQPLLKESTRRPMNMAFTPQSNQEDLAALKNPQAIEAPGPKVANLPVGGPTLQSKSFGGIRMKDLPFQTAGPESISAGNASNIPIAVGNNSAKSALAYSGPSLQDASKRRVGVVPGPSGTGASADTMALSAATPAPINVGTGGTGSAPTGATSGASLQQKSGSSSGLVNKALFGSGRGSGVGAGVEGMPSAAQALDNQLSQSGASDKVARRKGFELEGDVANRPIAFKVIPEYPAWAEEQGIMGSVRLYFTVDAAGNVRSNIRVTKTTGYPALDQLGIDALKKWKFAPLSSGDEGKGQWGIITFNFSLSS
jgi:TonB family protein